MKMAYKSPGERYIVTSRDSFYMGYIDAPLWMVRYDGSVFHVEFAPAIFESREPRTFEYSERFRWVDIESEEFDGGNVIQRIRRYIAYIGEFVKDPERYVRDPNNVESMNRLARELARDLNVETIQLYPTRGCEFFEGKGNDLYVFREDRRLVMREIDLDLMSMLIMMEEGRLPKEQIVVIYELLPVKRGGIIIGTARKPMWVFYTDNEGRRRYFPCEGSPFYGRDVQGVSEYVKGMRRMSEKICNGERLSFEDQKWLVAMAKKFAEREAGGSGFSEITEKGGKGMRAAFENWLISRSASSILENDYPAYYVAQVEVGGGFLNLNKEKRKRILEKLRGGTLEEIRLRPVDFKEGVYRGGPEIDY